jgi:putative endonuclease
MTLKRTGKVNPLKFRMTSHVDLGRRGEEFAAAYLQQAGYRIVAANFAIPVGRNRVGAPIVVEMDIVAYDDDVLCFVEVKTRSSDWFAEPQVNVDRRKRRQIARAARAYRRMFGLEGARYRYDVVTLVLPEELKPSIAPDIQLLRNYWREEQLKKRAWSDRYYE